MVKIRLRRVGAKHKPLYRIVVADSKSPRDGAFIQVIGSYNPLTDPETLIINEEMALSWLDKGAQPTQTTYRLLTKTGVMQKFSEANKTRKFKMAKRKSAQRKKKKSKSTTEVTS